jgi:hypothetical protein
MNVLNTCEQFYFDEYSETRANSIYYQAISKEYAFAYFPHESTKVTLQMPGISKTWHPLFYKRNENRKNFLMGKWLDFVRDNNVQEGDICLLEPTKDERRSTFTVYLLRASATHATGGDGFQWADQCPGGSIAKMASKVHINNEPCNGIIENIRKIAASYIIFF